MRRIGLTVLCLALCFTACERRSATHYHVHMNCGR